MELLGSTPPNGLEESDELPAAEGPNLNGSLSISCNLFDFFGAALELLCDPNAPNRGWSGSYAAAGWKELKKSSPPKSMSSFLAPSCLTWPLSCFLAKVMPPVGLAEAACIGLIFFPNCMLPLAGAEPPAAADEFTGTDMAWKVA